MPSDIPSVQNQDADTFRGIHLNPNAHHWDEVRSSDKTIIVWSHWPWQEEEDNDDFLGGVIEFGDGRQYTIQPTDPSISADSIGGTSNKDRDPQALIKKEDRFADDFDRSWPRSRTLSSFGRARGAPTHFPTSFASPSSPQESSRILFNERSNRLEPYSNSYPRHPPNGLSPLYVYLRVYILIRQRYYR